MPSSEISVFPLNSDICNSNCVKHVLGEYLTDESDEHKVVPFNKRGFTVYDIRFEKRVKISTKQCKIQDIA